MSDTERPTGRDRDHSYKQQLRIGTHVVDPGALSIQPAEGDAVRVKPKAMAVLLELARQPGVTVPREELLERVWEHTFVTPGVVAHAITALRRAFGDTLEQPVYIETIPRIGYRLLAPVEALERAPTTAEPAPMQAPIVAGTAEAPTVAPASPQPPPAQHPRRFSPLLLALPLLAVAAAMAWWLVARQPAQAAAQLRLDELRRITFAAGSEESPRLNAAGDWLVYTAAPDIGATARLQLQSVYGTQALPLAPDDHAERPAWSPQGRSVAYVWRDQTRCEIRVYDIDAQARQSIAACPAGSVAYLDWSPTDPALIAYSAVRRGQAGGTRLQLLRNRGGWRPLEFRYEHTAEHADLYPRFSPDGRSLAFRRSTNPTSDLYVVPVAGGKVTRLTRLRADLAGFDWLPDGSGLVFSSDHAGARALYAVRLGNGEVASLGMPDAASPDIAASAWRLTFRQDNWRSAMATLDVADAAQPAPLAPSSGRDEASAVAPDGQRMVLASDRDGSSQLWSLHTGTQRMQRLTQHNRARVEYPTISDDGTRVLYVLRASGRFEVWEHRFADAKGQRIATLPASVRNAVYAADGVSIWVVGWQGERWALHACTRKAALAPCTPQATAQSALRVERARVDGTDALVLVPATGGSTLRVVSEQGLRPLRELALPSWAAWQAVGDSVWYLMASDNDHDATLILHAASLRDGSSRQLAAYRGFPRMPATRFSVTPDRRQLVLPVITENSSDVMSARIRRARD